MQGIKVSNEYAEALGRLYRRAPKAVLAAIAVSFATTGGDHIEKAQTLILDEWRILHENGIVSQAPPRSVPPARRTIGGRPVDYITKRCVGCGRRRLMPDFENTCDRCLDKEAAK